MLMCPVSTPDDYGARIGVAWRSVDCCATLDWSYRAFRSRSPANPGEVGQSHRVPLAAGRSWGDSGGMRLRDCQKLTLFNNLTEYFEFRPFRQILPLPPRRLPEAARSGKSLNKGGFPASRERQAACLATEAVVPFGKGGYLRCAAFSEGCRAAMLGWHRCHSSGFAGHRRPRTVRGGVRRKCALRSENALAPTRFRIEAAAVTGIGTCQYARSTRLQVFCPGLPAGMWSIC